MKIVFLLIIFSEFFWKKFLHQKLFEKKFFVCSQIDHSFCATKFFLEIFFLIFRLFFIYEKKFDRTYFKIFFLSCKIDHSFVLDLYYMKSDYITRIHLDVADLRHFYIFKIINSISLNF